MGWDEPYSYTPSTDDHVFDPKAFTRASYAAPKAPTAKNNGNLMSLGFNRHPDAWGTIATRAGDSNAIDMSPNTKRNVRISRGVQLFFRILNMLGAVGILACVIMVQNVDETPQWIIRLAPAADILITTYAAFHLSRKETTRTPGSSASYHFFAMLMDIALVPFYVYIILVDRTELPLPVDDKERWTTMFQTPFATNQVLMTIWLTAIAMCGIHFLAAVNSTYLVRMFRKICNLPPDMNPLEDNLTSRRRSKHKYKDSELSSKHDSAISFSSSKHPEVAERPMSFLQTRMGSEDDVRYSPHNPRTANESRTSLPIPMPGIYSNPSSARNSHLDLASQGQELRADSPNKQRSALSHTVSIQSGSSVYSDRQSEKSQPMLPRKSSKRVSGTFSSTDNWYAVEDDNEDQENHVPSVSVVEEEPEDGLTRYQLSDDAPAMTRGSLPLPGQSRPYQPIRQSSFVDVPLNGDLSVSAHRYGPTPPPKNQRQNRPPRITAHNMQPLGMNPPTPPGTRDPRSRSPNTSSWPLSDTTGNVPSARSSPSPNKSKYYGDLSAIGAGARQSLVPGPQPLPQKRAKSPGLGVGAWFASSQAGTDRQGRVISRSGADLGDGGGRNDYWEDVPGDYQPNNGARKVSGKVAEEGWGGMWARRRISGR